MVKTMLLPAHTGISQNEVKTVVVGDQSEHVVTCNLEEEEKSFQGPSYTIIGVGNCSRDSSIRSGR